METWTCEWFAFCTKQTTQGVAHPILGVIPCCTRCAKLLDLDLAYTLTPVSA